MLTSNWFDTPIMPDLPLPAIWVRILAALGAVLLTCGVKNYLAFAVSGTGLCPYLCPALLRVELAIDLPWLAAWFAVQTAVTDGFQYLVRQWFADPFRLTGTLLLAPVLEEALYRGPLYLARGTRQRTAWWGAGLLLSGVFALSHGRSGLALLPLVVLGMGSLWLIATTHRFWPGIALHFLHNFFFASVTVYQSLWVGD